MAEESPLHVNRNFFKNEMKKFDENLAVVQQCVMLP